MEVRVRPLQGRSELDACVELQRRVWGRDFEDRVPASILMVALETGGVVSGAFLDGRLVGFVFGLTGLRDGATVHWSDMLAVEPGLRGRGIGRRLKLHQRELLIGRGVHRMLWTFDPLEARNAHLNLRVLGARARVYHRDLYGDSSSPLHAGLGTDRLLAEWDLDRDPGPGQPAGDVEARRVAVPADIQALKAADPRAARTARERVRAELESALGDGFTVTDFERGEPSGHYVLTRPTARGDRGRRRAGLEGSGGGS